MEILKKSRTIWEKLQLVGMFVLLACCVLFLFQNIQQVEVSFLFWTISTPRVFLLLGTLGVGCVIGYLAARIGKKHPTR